MSHLFNIGDTVRRINESNSSYAQVGQIAKVVGLDGDGDPFVEYGGMKDRREVWFARNTELVARARAEEVTLPSELVLQPPLTAPGLQWVALHNESARIYHFPDGSKFIVEDATRLCVRPTSHRLETVSDRKFIIPGKFTAIEIIAKEWSA